MRVNSAVSEFHSSVMDRTPKTLCSEPPLSALGILRTVNFAAELAQRPTKKHFIAEMSD